VRDWGEEVGRAMKARIVCLLPGCPCRRLGDQLPKYDVLDRGLRDRALLRREGWCSGAPDWWKGVYLGVAGLVHDSHTAYIDAHARDWGRWRTFRRRRQADRIFRANIEALGRAAGKDFRRIAWIYYKGLRRLGWAWRLLGKVMDLFHLE
jgi:hypothetical protein